MRFLSRTALQLLHATLVAVLSIAVSIAALAGPPYLTDDPDPVPYHHWEFYTFMAQDRTRSSNANTGPAIELNNGVAPNTQLHLVIPDAYYFQNGMHATGLGDMEAGVKYRFLTETKNRPEIGIFPLVELPTGNQSDGLGNGRTWGKAPIWLEKSWGAWTTYGGGGYAFNAAPGQRNYGYGGVLLQRTLSPALIVGAEVFIQGAQVESDPSTPQSPGACASAIWNFGGSYNFTPDFSLLFTAGHSFQGDGHSTLYLGLYRTWGPGAP